MTQILPNTCGILSARSWRNRLEHGPGPALSDSDPTLPLLAVCLRTSYASLLSVFSYIYITAGEIPHKALGKLRRIVMYVNCISVKSTDAFGFNNLNDPFPEFLPKAQSLHTTHNYFKIEI